MHVFHILLWMPIPAYDDLFRSILCVVVLAACTFVLITEHEGRIIQNHTEDSIIREIEKCVKYPVLRVVVSDLGTYRQYA